MMNKLLAYVFFVLILASSVSAYCNETVTYDNGTSGNHTITKTCSTDYEGQELNASVFILIGIGIFFIVAALFFAKLSVWTVPFAFIFGSLALLIPFYLLNIGMNITQGNVNALLTQFFSIYLLFFIFFIFISSIGLLVWVILIWISLMDYWKTPKWKRKGVKFGR